MFSQAGLTEFSNLSPEAGAFVFDAIDFGMYSLDIDDGPDASFTPFAMIQPVDDGPEILRLFDDETHPDIERGVAMGRELLADIDRPARYVALGWDGYSTLSDGVRTETVFVEAYELGRTSGVLMGQRYQRFTDGIEPIGNPILLDDATTPLVPGAARR